MRLSRPGSRIDNESMQALIVICTCPDEVVAKRIAEALVGERLAACVNLLPAVASTYRWEGKICRETESMMLIKTTRDRFQALRERLLSLHPYDVPEIVAVDIATGSAAYLDWIGRETRT